MLIEMGPFPMPYGADRKQYVRITDCRGVVLSLHDSEDGYYWVSPINPSKEFRSAKLDRAELLALYEACALALNAIKSESTADARGTRPGDPARETAVGDPQGNPPRA